MVQYSYTNPLPVYETGRSATSDRARAPCLRAPKNGMLRSLSVPFRCSPKAQHMLSIDRISPNDKKEWFFSLDMAYNAVTPLPPMNFESRCRGPMGRFEGMAESAEHRPQGGGHPRFTPSAPLFLARSVGWDPNRRRVGTRPWPTNEPWDHGFLRPRQPSDPTCGLAFCSKTPQTVFVGSPAILRRAR